MADRVVWMKLPVFANFRFILYYYGKALPTNLLRAIWDKELMPLSGGHLLIVLSF